jgi:hypothetical protein
MDKTKAESPRKQMGMGEDPFSDIGNFGVQSIASMDQKDGESPKSGRAVVLSDAERAGGKPVKHTESMLPAQAEPDHGPHF